MKILKLLFCIAFLLPGFSRAQSITIKGTVIDKTTKEPMMFTNVMVEKTDIGTTTDENGNYELILEHKVDSITCTSVGYTKEKKPVSTSPTQTINFEMTASQSELEEVIILPGLDHADIMMKKVIAAKESNNPKRFESFSYESYNKLEIDLDEMSKKFLDKKILKPFHFIFENMDSVSEEKPFLPIFMTESLSDYYYRKEPRKTKEIIKGTKVSGIKNESVNQFLGTMYQNINVYDNWLNVLDKSFASPMSDQGFFYYKYYLMDTAMIGTDTIYKIHFKPKRKQENTFVGDLWIVNSTWSLYQISMTVDKDANINFVNRVALFQEYNKVNENGWLLVKDKLVAVFAATKENTPGLIGRKTTTYRNIKINPLYIDKYLEGIDDIVVLEDADEHDENFWKENRHDSLSKNERAIYAMVDSLKEMPAFKTWVDYITIIATGYKVLGPIEIGPYFNIYSNNFVEGSRFRLGFRTSNKLSTRYEVGAFGAYGLKDKRFKYGAHGIWVIQRQPRRDITVKYFHDLDVSNPDPQEFGQDNILSGLYRRKIPQKLTFQDNLLISYFHELKFGYSNKITFTRRDIHPYFDFSYYNNDKLPNLILDTSRVRTAEMKFLTHFAYKEKFVSSNIYRTSLGSKYPALDVEYTLGMKGLLGSNYHYHKLSVAINDWFNIPPLGWSSYYIKAGKTFGKLPFLLLDILPGNETYFYNSGAFNLMNNYEFITDQYAMILWNHHFEGLFLNKIPLLRKLKLRWLVSGKAAFGTMTDKNKLINSAPINYIKINTPFPKPYAEASVGLENIFKIIRVDAIWRLTYRDMPDAAPFGVRVGMQLYF